MTDFGSQKGAQREPKSDPKPTQIEDKNRCEKNTSSRSSWGRLVVILRRFVAALGAILEKHQKINQKTMPKMIDFGSQKGAQREPKSNPKPTKIEDKNRCEKRTEPKPSWNRFGAILGRFGSPLGVIFIDFSLVFKAFRENSRFSKNSVSRAVLSPTWPILGRFWPPKRLQDAPQKRPTAIKNRC